jgi:gliding motility-associated-like protein
MKINKISLLISVLMWQVFAVSAQTVLQPGQAQGSLLSQVCLGTNVTLRFTAATGGNGTYDYQWQSSTNREFWGNIEGAKGLTYTATNLTQSTYFRRYVVSAGQEATTSEFQVTVLPKFSSPNLLDSIGPKCGGGDEWGLFGNDMTGTEGVEVGYSFFESTNKNGPWMESSMYPSLDSTTHFIRVASSPARCNSDTSQILTVQFVNPLVVTSILDDIDNFFAPCGTLRRAVSHANDNYGVRDTITFQLPQGQQVINLQGQLSINESVYFKGPGKDMLAIDGGGSNSIFKYYVEPPRLARAQAWGDTTVISGITFQNAVSSTQGQGGAITFDAELETLVLKNCQFYNNNGNYGGGGLLFRSENLYVDSCYFSGNRAADDYFGTGNGAGINADVADGQLVIKNSTFKDGYAYGVYSGYVGNGHGLYVTGYNFGGLVEACTFSGNTSISGGALYYLSNSQALSLDSLTIVNSTFVGNQAENAGGAIYAGGWSSKLKLLNATISANGVDSVDNNDGGYFYPAGGGVSVDGTLITQNSILAGNKGQRGRDLYFQEASKFTSKGGNILGTVGDHGVNNVEVFTLLPSDKSGTVVSPLNPFLSSLGKNGGFTETLVPLAGSPAINAGVNAGSPIVDQRGSARNVGGVDAGAVETDGAVCANPLLVNSAQDEMKCGTLRYAVEYANMIPGDDAITFDSKLSGATTMVNRVLNVTDSLSIYGPVGNVRLSGANSQDGLMYVSEGVSKLSLSRLSFSDTKLTESSVFYYNNNTGHISLSNCVFENNHVNGYGQTFYVSATHVSIDSCKFRNNSVRSGESASGGGLYFSFYNANSTLEFKNTEINGNEAIQANGSTGGGLYISAYGQSTVPSNSITFERCAIYNNKASIGAGIYVNSENVFKNLRIINSTISGNVAKRTGGGLYMRLGADTSEIVNSTIYNNQAQGDSASLGQGQGISLPGAGGGIYTERGYIKFTNTIVAGNTAKGGLGDDLGKSRSSEGFAYFSQGHNLVSDTVQSGFFAGGGEGGFRWETTDIVGDTAQAIDPLLSDLAYNGGITKNHLPKNGSPVIDNGLDLATVLLDQRGRARIGTTDIGSVEYANDSLKANAGRDVSTCADTVTLAASTIDAEYKGKWTKSPKSSLVFVNGVDSVYNAKITNLKSARDTLIWTISKKQSQYVSRDTVIITNGKVSVSIIKPSPLPSIVVNQKSVQLADSVVSFIAFTTQWFRNDTLFTLPTGGLVTFKKDLSKFKVKVSNAGCSALDSIIVTYVDTTKAFAGNPKEVYADSTLLEAFKPAAGYKGKWTKIGVSSIFIVNDTLHDTKLRNIPFGETSLVWTLTSPDQKVTRDTVVITRVKITISATTTQPVCSQANGVIQISLLPSSNFADTFVGDTIKSAATSSLKPGTYKVRISRNGLPVKDTSFVLKAVNPYSLMLNIEDTALCDGGSTVLKGKLFPDSAATFGWSGVKSSFADSVLASDSGKYILTATVGNSGCVLKDTAHVKILATPVVSAGADTNTCFPTARLRASNLKQGETGAWRRLTGNSEITSAFNPVANVFNLSPFDPVSGLLANQFEWSVANGACSAKDTVQVRYSVAVYATEDTTFNGIAGKIIRVPVTKNDLFSLGDKLDVKPDSSANPVVVSITIEADTMVVFETNPFGFDQEKVFTYVLYNQCGVSDTSTIRIKTRNERPRPKSFATTFEPSASALVFSGLVSEVDDNPNVDSVAFLQPISPAGGILKAYLSPDRQTYYLTVDYSNVPNYAGTETVAYRLCDAERCEEALWTIVVTKPEGGLNVYQALSPNGDGKNDFVEIENITLEKYKDNKVQIFNRWGDKVFEVDDYNNKDRAFDGADLPDGTYYYMIKLEGESQYRKGFIVLKR